MPRAGPGRLQEGVGECGVELDGRTGQVVGGDLRVPGALRSPLGERERLGNLGSWV